MPLPFAKDLLSGELSLLSFWIADEAPSAPFTFFSVDDLDFALRLVGILCCSYKERREKMRKQACKTDEKEGSRRKRKKLNRNFQVIRNMYLYGDDWGTPQFSRFVKNECC